MNLILKFAAVLLLFLGKATFFGQEIYDKYPTGQNFYEGGEVAFYKDINEAIRTNNIKNCANKSEYYEPKLIVYPDRTIKFVKDTSAIVIEKNKCAFEFSRNVLQYVKNWKPASIDGEEVAAAVNVLIVPDALVENYKEGYKSVDSETIPEFVGGINEFRKRVAQNINFSRFNIIQKFRVVVRFVVGVDGKLEDIEIIESSGIKEFDEMVIKSVRSVKNKWKPATVNGSPVRSLFHMPLAFNPS